MHAIRQHEFGPAETLLYEEVSDPSPAWSSSRFTLQTRGQTRQRPLSRFLASFARSASSPER